MRVDGEIFTRPPSQTRTSGGFLLCLQVSLCIKNNVKRGEVYYMQYKIINVRDNPDFLDIAADYFSSKWSIERQVYYDSISDSISTQAAIPRWYLIAIPFDIGILSSQKTA